jgi:hypothetical protein
VLDSTFARFLPASSSLSVPDAGLETGSDADGMGISALAGNENINELINRKIRWTHICVQAINRAEKCIAGVLS